ncbi:MAG: J domain-containing protein [bacterium]|nr:J domain-containing protein [bacterium]
MRDKDPLGYYAVLGLKPSASNEDIKRAYASVRMGALTLGEKVDVETARAAFQTLANESSRATYDGRDGASVFRPRSWGWQQYAMLGGTLGMIALIGLLAFPRGMVSVRAVFTNFDVGETLYRIETRNVLGTVVRYEKQHQFPNGSRRSAYEIQHVSGLANQWYPASEIDGLYGAAQTVTAAAPPSP